MKKTIVTNNIENGNMVMEYLNDSSLGNTGLSTERWMTPTKNPKGNQMSFEFWPWLFPRGSPAYYSFQRFLFAWG